MSFPPPDPASAYIMFSIGVVAALFGAWAMDQGRRALDEASERLRAAHAVHAEVSMMTAELLTTISAGEGRE